VKKLALVLSTFGLLTIATPVFACPGHEDDAKADAPKTAEKDKKQEAPKKKEAPAKKKTDDSKKTGDKVSMK
jgi:hypothetical protein